MSIATTTLESKGHEVPSFALYGEHADWPTPDFLHWESVSERSALHNWRIKPHRHGSLMQLLLLTQGSAVAQIDARQEALALPCLLVIPPMCVHGFEFSVDVDGHVVTIASPLLQSINKNLGEYAAFLQLSHILEIDCQQQSLLSTLFNNIAYEYRQQQVFRDLSLQAAVSQLLIWIVRNGQSPQTEGKQQPTSGRQYFSQFMQLVEQHFCKHLSLDSYAAQLCISKPHLNSLCRQYADRSALQLIHQRLLLEAKRDLIYTVLTVSDIADKLGFSEPPYFTRFFKRLTGKSPREFRQQ